MQIYAKICLKSSLCAWQMDVQKPRKKALAASEGESWLQGLRVLLFLTSAEGMG